MKILKYIPDEKNFVHQNIKNDVSEKDLIICDYSITNDSINLCDLINVDSIEDLTVEILYNKLKSLRDSL